MLLGYKNFLNKEYILVVVFIAIDKRQTQRFFPVDPGERETDV